MTYALEIADPARDALGRLEGWLAEETLDEIEKLAERPPQQRSQTATSVHDFVRVRGTSRFYVFIVVFR